MKAVKVIAAMLIAAVLAGCVVYPVGYGGGYGRPHHGGYYHRY